MEYPTLFTGRGALAGAGHRADAGDDHGPRGRTPVVVRHGGQQRVRARVDGRRHQHLRHRARDRRGLHDQPRRERVLRRLHPVDDCTACRSRASTTTAWPAIATTRKPTCRPRPPGATGPRRPPSSPTTRPRCGCTRWSATWAGPPCRRSSPPTSSDGSSGIPKPEDFFAVVREVSGQDLTWFFDEVYRSSNTFDYAVQDVRSDQPAGRPLPHHGGGAPAGRGDLPRGGRDHVRGRRAGDGALGRPRPPGRSSNTSAPQRATSAVVDPRRVLLLDVNYTNNSRHAGAAVGPGQPEVGAQLDGVAAAADAVLRLLRLT